MTAKVLNLSIEQGATFLRTLIFKDSLQAAIDLTGYQFRGSIRSTAKSDTVLGSFYFVIESPESDGIVTMSMSASATSALPTNGADYSKTTKATYDVEMIDTLGTVTRILNGEVLISPEVTR